jgi:hypothetical protein
MIAVAEAAGPQLQEEILIFIQRRMISLIIQSSAFVTSSHAPEGAGLPTSSI